MERVTRRVFFRRAGSVAAVVGAATVVPMGVAGAAIGPKPDNEPALTQSENLAADEHLIAHVIDARAGIINLYIGQREVTIKDRKVAARLVRAAR